MPVVLLTLVKGSERADSALCAVIGLALRLLTGQNHPFPTLSLVRNPKREDSKTGEEIGNPGLLLLLCCIVPASSVGAPGFPRFARADTETGDRGGSGTAESQAAHWVAAICYRTLTVTPSRPQSNGKIEF